MTRTALSPSPTLLFCATHADEEELASCGPEDYDRLTAIDCAILCRLEDLRIVASWWQRAAEQSAAPHPKEKIMTGATS